MCASKRPRSLALLAAVAVLGCAVNPAPLGWRPNAAALQTRTLGGWIVVYERVREAPAPPARAVVAATWSKAGEQPAPTPRPTERPAAPEPGCPPGVAAGSRNPLAAGELLAVHETEIHVLTGTKVTTVAMECIGHATLSARADDSVLLGVWSLAGALSTLSHGWLLTASFPMWLSGGIATTAAESRSGLVRFPQQDWSAFRAYARFPQGLPENFAPESAATN